MPIEEPRHVSLPILHGAPAYARPAPPVVHSRRPFDPDELPIVAEMTAEERAFLEGGMKAPQRAQEPGDGLRPRSFSLRGLAQRIRRAGG